MTQRDVVVGVSDHGGWAIFVTATSDGRLLDRRRVELIDDALPALPHHHDAQGLPLKEAAALIERVRTSAEKHAAIAFESLANDVDGITAIALRVRQPLPLTIEERINDVRARNVADWIMYREALASAAEARGWSIHWFDPKKTLASVDPALLDVRREIGPPWTQEHKLAMAAAIAGTRAR